MIKYNAGWLVIIDDTMVMLPTMVNEDDDEIKIIPVMPMVGEQSGIVVEIPRKTPQSDIDLLLERAEEYSKDIQIRIPVLIHDFFNNLDNHS